VPSDKSERVRCLAATWDTAKRAAERWRVRYPADVSLVLAEGWWTRIGTLLAPVTTPTLLYDMIVRVLQLIGVWWTEEGIVIS